MALALKLTISLGCQVQADRKGDASSTTVFFCLYLIMPRICFLLLRSRSIHRELQLLSRGDHWTLGDSCSGSCAADVHATCANWLATGREGQTDGIHGQRRCQVLFFEASPERTSCSAGVLVSSLDAQNGEPPSAPFWLALMREWPSLHLAP